jgi:hypothetical protein
MSVVLNAVFTMVVLGVVPFLLYMSALSNILLAWFIYKSMNRAEKVRDDTLTILKSIENFATHLEKLHEMELYYGDSDMQDLIHHSRTLINEIIDMQEEYYDDLEITTEEYENDADEETKKEE